jgi:hypothetical protein
MNSSVTSSSATDEDIINKKALLEYINSFKNSFKRDLYGELFPVGYTITTDLKSQLSIPGISEILWSLTDITFYNNSGLIGQIKATFDAGNPGYYDELSPAQMNGAFLLDYSELGITSSQADTVNSMVLVWEEFGRSRGDAEMIRSGVIYRSSGQIHKDGMSSKSFVIYPPFEVSTMSGLGAHLIAVAAYTTELSSVDCKAQLTFVRE